MDKSIRMDMPRREGPRLTLHFLFPMRSDMTIHIGENVMWYALGWLTWFPMIAAGVLIGKALKEPKEEER